MAKLSEASPAHDCDFSPAIFRMLWVAPALTPRYSLAGTEPDVRAAPLGYPDLSAPACAAHLICKYLQPAINPAGLSRSGLSYERAKSADPVYPVKLRSLFNWQRPSQLCEFCQDAPRSVSVAGRKAPRYTLIEFSRARVKSLRGRNDPFPL